MEGGKPGKLRWKSQGEQKRKDANLALIPIGDLQSWSGYLGKLEEGPNLRGSHAQESICTYIKDKDDRGGIS